MPAGANTDGAPAPTPAPTSIGGHAALVAGLVCVSTSGPFLRMTGMDAYAVAFWRMVLSAALFLAWAAVRGELRVAPGHVRRLVLGGVLLAAHFALWIKAFDLTNYASNLV